MIPNSSKFIFFLNKKYPWGVFGLESIRFFSAFAPPNFSVKKSFFESLALVLHTGKMAERYLGIAPVDTVDGSEIGLAAITTFWIYKPL